jgi:hypothetical protein
MSEDAPLPPVSMLRLFFRMGGWFVVGVTVAFLGVTAVAQLFFGAAQRFEAEGRPVVALVTEKRVAEGRDSDGDRTVTYWLTLEYVTGAGEEIRQATTVTMGEYRAAEEGEALEIWYLESDPTRVEVTKGENAGSARVFRVMSLVLGVIWLGLFWLVGRWVVEAVRARRYGACERAEVTEVYRTAISVNNRPRYRVKWCDGQGRPGQSLLEKRRDVEKVRPGDRVRIYQGLKRAWWAKDIGDRDDTAG